MEFDEPTIERVWERARASGEQDPLEWRRDECGAWIRRELYGDFSSDFGWKIEATRPGKLTDLENLRPFQHANSYDVANHRAHCRVTADREETSPVAQLDQPRNRPV